MSSLIPSHVPLYNIRVGCGNVPLVEINIGLLANQVGVTASNTLNLGQGDHNLLLAVNIGVEQTQDVLEVRLLAGNEGCSRQKSAIRSHPLLPFAFSILHPQK